MGDPYFLLVVCNLRLVWISITYKSSILFIGYWWDLKHKSWFFLLWQIFNFIYFLPLKEYSFVFVFFSSVLCLMLVQHILNFIYIHGKVLRQMELQLSNKLPHISQMVSALTAIIVYNSNQHFSSFFFYIRSSIVIKQKHFLSFSFFDESIFDAILSL